MLRSRGIELEGGEAVGAGRRFGGLRSFVAGAPRSGRVEVLTFSHVGHCRGDGRSACPDDRLEIDRPDVAGPARVGPHGGGRDDAADEALDRGLLAGIQARAIDPDPPADVEVLPPGACGDVDRDEVRADLDAASGPAPARGAPFVCVRATG